MAITRFALLLLLTVLAPGLGRQSLPAPPSRVIVLGDSLSDIGNAASVADYVLGQPFYPKFTVGLCNPVDIFLLDRDCDELIYGKSRASNGPVAVELLAAGLGLALEPSFHLMPERPIKGTDYAVAGATAAGHGTNDLATQIDLLRLDRGPALPPDALYVLMIGGNDALAAVRSEVEARAGRSPDQTSQQIVASAVAAIGKALDTLSESGARRLIVANLPNLAPLPVIRERARALDVDSTMARQAADAVTRGFNRSLLALLKSARSAHPETRIEAFDLYAVMEHERLAPHPAPWNTSAPCFDSETYRASAAAKRVFAPDCAPLDGGPPRFDRFFFWDGIHPTAVVHSAIGVALLAAWYDLAADERKLPG